MRGVEDACRVRRIDVEGTSGSVSAFGDGVRDSQEVNLQRVLDLDKAPASSTEAGVLRSSYLEHSVAR